MVQTSGKVKLKSTGEIGYIISYLPNNKVELDIVKVVKVDKILSIPTFYRKTVVVSSNDIQILE